MSASGHASGSGTGRTRQGTSAAQEAHESITLQQPQLPPPAAPFTDMSKMYIDKVETLEGRSNYEDWSYQLLMVWRAMHATDTIVNGKIPSNRASAADKAEYNYTNERATLILIQVSNLLHL
ncbi:hypothetical protein BGX38DRAFT_1143077 [Terfezia claveryi]|nr:hypothetical protein BGX38DRAFT_1143077 [Terfezia claveryi]